MNSYGLVIVSGVSSRVFEVDEEGNGDGFIVPAPGVKLVRWKRLYNTHDLHIYEHPHLDFYAAWSDDEHILKTIKELIVYYPGKTLRQILS